jgi:hypothetical protein
MMHKLLPFLALLLTACASSSKAKYDPQKEAEAIAYCKSVSDVITRENNVCGPYFDRVKSEIALEAMKDKERRRAEDEAQKLAIQAAANAPRNPPGAKSFALAGSLTLVHNFYGNDNCYGSGGFDDIKSGMQVTVRDGEGRILATSQVGSGKRVSPSECRFEFAFVAIPKSKFYAIGMATSDKRGLLNYSFEDLQNKDWTISLVIS